MSSSLTLGASTVFGFFVLRVRLPEVLPGCVCLDGRAPSLSAANRILGRVVKALDLSPSGHSPREFEPRRMQLLSPSYGYGHSGP